MDCINYIVYKFPYIIIKLFKNVLIYIHIKHNIPTLIPIKNLPIIIMNAELAYASIIQLVHIGKKAIWSAFRLPILSVSVPVTSNPIGHTMYGILAKKQKHNIIVILKVSINFHIVLMYCGIWYWGNIKKNNDKKKKLAIFKILCIVNLII